MNWKGLIVDKEDLLAVKDCVTQRNKPLQQEEISHTEAGY